MISSYFLTIAVFIALSFTQSWADSELAQAKEVVQDGGFGYDGFGLDRGVGFGRGFGFGYDGYGYGHGKYALGKKFHGDLKKHHGHHQYAHKKGSKFAKHKKYHDLYFKKHVEFRHKKGHDNVKKAHINKKFGKKHHKTLKKHLKGHAHVKKSGHGKEGFY